LQSAAFVPQQRFQAAATVFSATAHANLSVTKTSSAKSRIQIGLPQLSASGDDADKSTSTFDDYEDIGGTKRGVPLGVLVLLISIWGFSVPPEFRRAHFCFSDRCTQNRTAYMCNDCVTFGEWTRKVADYYANGGGIQWDFSIDPDSKMRIFK